MSTAYEKNIDLENRVPRKGVGTDGKERLEENDHDSEGYEDGGETYTDGASSKDAFAVLIAQGEFRVIISVVT